MDHSCEDWMSGLPEALWDVPLTDLSIPGSHDAMSYCLDINSPLVPSESNTFRLLDKLFYCFTRPVLFKWATTQDNTIVEQLSMGIRYFDLRIARKPKDSSNDLYFKHIIYTHLPVLETLMFVEKWLKSHQKEIVILACSHFVGIDDDLHKSLILSLKKLFGSKLCPRGSVLTLRSLWKCGYQVLLSYEDEAAVRHEELWPAIPYWWANKKTAKEVISYLDSQKDLGRPEGFFVSGLNLTAERSYIILHLKQSLRKMTMRNWECLKKWVEDQTPGSEPKSLNIIAGDLVGTLPLCPLVIALNQKLIQE
ncbi:hypothetical protein LDENG_00121370 [Lucifuga dentata]|nr:hypothetical protein LDENG_00121370 [Lucifuga dentata]